MQPNLHVQCAVTMKYGLKVKQLLSLIPAGSGFSIALSQDSAIHSDDTKKIQLVQ